MASKLATEKTTTEKALDIVRPAHHELTIAGRKYVVKQQVTRNVLRQQDGVPIYVQIVSEMALAPGWRKSSDDMPQPMVCDVVNLETGELQYLICNEVLRRELEVKFPDNAYINKFFALESALVAVQGRAGQRVRVYRIEELASVNGE